MSNLNKKFLINNSIETEKSTSCTIDMGRNSTQPKIKIKIKTILQRAKLHSGIFRLHLFFLLKNVRCTLVTATAHDVTKQRIRSVVPQL